MSGRVESARRWGLRVGDSVALALEVGSAPRRCYIGSVEYVGADGVRIATMAGRGFVAGTVTGCDLFVPWQHITSALVSPLEHDRSRFLDDAEAWQERMEPSP